MTFWEGKTMAIIKSSGVHGAGVGEEVEHEGILWEAVVVDTFPQRH